MCNATLLIAIAQLPVTEFRLITRRPSRLIVSVGDIDVLEYENDRAARSIERLREETKARQQKISRLPTTA